MQNSRFNTFVVSALLLTLGLAAVFATRTHQVKAGPISNFKYITKVTAANRTEVPFVSNDVHQTSRANNTSPLKFWHGSLSLLLSPPVNQNDLRGLLFVNEPAYQPRFKKLFPAHEFS